MQSNKYNRFTAVFAFMTNIQDLIGLQRSEMACLDQYLFNILCSSTQTEKTQTHHSLLLKGNNPRIYVQTKTMRPSVQVILKLPYIPILHSKGRIWSNSGTGRVSSGRFCRSFPVVLLVHSHI